MDTGNAPDLVGIPESTPSVLSVSPSGSVPVLLQVRGLTPPVATKLNPASGEFSVPIVGAGVVLMVGLTTVIAKSWLTGGVAADASLTVRTTWYVAATVRSVP